MKSVSVDLGKSTLLVKRRDCEIQNASEILNHLIWTKFPKNVFLFKHCTFQQKPYSNQICATVIELV